MYVHPAFHVGHQHALAMLKARAFGTLVVADPDGRPSAVHLPFLVEARPEGGLRVELHVARSNPIHGLVSPGGHPALLICQGPDAYISPDWYGVPNQVPTWTYTAVHLAGVLAILPEAEGVDHVDRLSAEFEERLRPKTPWTAGKMEAPRRAAMMKAIVTMALVVPPDGIEAQHKLIQHKGEVEHRGAIAGLRSRGDAGSAAVAALMEQSLASRGQRRDA